MEKFKPRPGLLTVGHFIRSNYWTKSIVCKDMNQCQKKTIQKNQQKTIQHFKFLEGEEDN